MEHEQQVEIGLHGGGTMIRHRDDWCEVVLLLTVALCVVYVVVVGRACSASKYLVQTAAATERGSVWIRKDLATPRLCTSHSLLL